MSLVLFRMRATRYASFGVAAAAITYLFVLILAGVGHADVVSSDPSGVTPAAITLQPYVVAIIIGTITPLLTGLITKLGASDGVKAIVSFVLIAIATVLNQIVHDNGTFVWRDTIILFATTLVMHIATFYGIWSPMGHGPAPTAKLLPDVGVGGGTPAQ